MEFVFKIKKIYDIYCYIFNAIATSHEYLLYIWLNLKSEGVSYNGVISELTWRI